MDNAPASDTQTRDSQTLFAALEAELATGASRGADKLAPYAAGGLERAATHLAQTRSPVAFFTGFFVAHADRPAAETDGPLTVLAITEALFALGREAVIVTDAPCAPVLYRLVAEAGLPPDVLFVPETPDALAPALKARGVETVFAIERPGRAIDGRCYSMRAQDLSAHTLAFDPVFSPRSGFTRLAAGDGGNEIGMGVLPKSALFSHIDQGRIIASATGADALIVTGVSHWTGYALAAAMTSVAPKDAATWRDAVSDAREGHRLSAALSAGAVDGVTAHAAPTIDGLPLETHLAKRDRLFALTRSAV